MKQTLVIAWKKAPLNDRPAKELLRLAFVGAVTVVSTAGAELRELNTDRPDATESPFTVDAGHWQIEADLVSRTRNRIEGFRTAETDIAPFNVRLGLSANVEAGLFFAPYIRVSEEPRGGPRETHAGQGDTTLRAKFNFQGNDGGAFAYGLIFDVKLPTVTRGLGNGHVEGDVIFPVAFELPAGWELGAMTVLDLHHRDRGGLQAGWINSVTVGHDLFRNVSGYVELVSVAGEGSHQASFDFGVAWKLNANTQLDAGANLGLSRSADDVQFFTGLSRRF